MSNCLETKRLYFRPFKKSDAKAMFEMDKNPNVHQYLWNQPLQNIDEVAKVIDYLQKQYKENEIGRYATFLKQTNEFIGWTGIKFINDHVENGKTNFYDYGYRLDEKFWNNGYATEASHFWIDYAFNQMKIAELNAYAQAENGASNHILQKVGFQFIEDYFDDAIKWNWWQFLKSDFRN